MFKHLRIPKISRKKGAIQSLKTRVMQAFVILVFVGSVIGMTPTGVMASGTTYFVDKTNGSCSDLGPGSSGVPFCTIGKGASVAAPGDTVSVVAGSYAETVEPTISGTSGNPITYSAAAGVTVTGDGTATGSAFRFNSLSFITVDGFTVSNTSETGILMSGGSNFTITNNTVTGTKSHGIYDNSANNVTISNNHVSNSGKQVGSIDGNGIYLKTLTTATVSGNTSDHNFQDGIRINGDSGVTVSNNTTFANDDGTVNAKNNGIALINTSFNNTIIHNTVYGNRDSGIQVDSASHNNSILGNVSYDNADHGIDNNAAPNQIIVGNTFQGNFTSGINLELNSGGATISDNILADNGINPSGGRKPGNLYVDDTSVAGTTANYNLYWYSGSSIEQIDWNLTGYTSLAAFKTAVPSQEVNGLQGNPLFVAPASPATDPPTVATGNYHLTLPSPAIDSADSGAAGEPSSDLDGHGRIDDPSTANTGAGSFTYYDRGAYEFQPVASPTVSTQSATNISQTSATGNGTIVSLGSTNPTQHGVAWSTSANPTTSDSHTTDGPVSVTGAFTSIITGLNPSTLYHVRAYATNASGTSYGGDVNFTTGAANVVTITSPAITTWVVPAGVTLVTAEVWGGGGKGGARTTGTGSQGGGGGGGYSIKASIAVTAGASIPISIGAGATTTSAGSDSFFKDISTVLAKGGGSVADNTSTGAAGGAAASGVGDTKRSGGSGANGSSGGGGGGSSAGTGADGANGSGSSGGTAPTGGGNGGDGRTGTSGTGTNGSTPGGGGGGSFRLTSGSSGGGNGANGQIRITYFIVSQATTTTVNCGAGTPTVTYGSSINCVATVTAGSGTPTGNVNWTTGGAGAFDFTSCVLASGSCSVNYTPSAVGTGSHLITATYPGNTPFLTSNGNQTVTVNTKALSITANNAIKTYGDLVTFAGTEFTPTGLINGNTVTSVTLTSAGAPVTATVVGSPYTIVPSAAVGTGLANYTITYTNGSLTVNPKALTVTASNRIKTYGDLVTFAGTEFTTTPGGLINGNTITSVTLNSTGAPATALVSGSPFPIVPSAAVGSGVTNYTITYANGSLTVNTKALTTSGILANNKPYDGNTTATLNTAGGSLVGVVNSDAVSLDSSGASATFADKNVGTHKAVTAIGFALSGTPAGNYTLTQPSGLQADITAKSLTVTGLIANNKVYDGGTAATFNTGSASLVGVVSPDVVTLDSSGATGTFVDKNVAIGKAVTALGFALAGADKNNYSLTQPTGLTANITALGITGTITANNKVYDATTTATIATRNLTGVIGLDDVQYAGGTATFSDKNVANGKTVSATGLSLTGTAAGNYTVNTTATTTANITQKELTVTGVLANNKVYDRNTSVVVNATGAALVGNLDGGNVLLNTSIVAGTFTPNGNVGTGKTVQILGLTISGSASGNYFLTQPTTTADITPFALTGHITADNKVYDGGTVASIATRTLTGVISPDVVTYVGGTAAFSDKNIGTGKTVTGSGLSLSGADAGNYSVNASPTTTANITPLAITVTAATDTKTYDGTTSSAGVPTVTVGALQGSDTPNFTETFDNKNVGTGKTLTPSGTVNDGNSGNNYTVSFATNTTGVINQLNITVTADDKTKYAGSPDPAFTYSSLPVLFSGDTFTGALTRTSGEAVGSYPIQQGTLSAGGNYHITYVGANLTINPKIDANVEVHIGGGLQGTYTVSPNTSTKVSYSGVDSGPVKVASTNTISIIAAVRDAWSANGTPTSFAQLMGLPASQLSDTYVFPAYNNVTLNEQLRIGNVDSVPTTVTVTIGGVLRGTYPLAANEAVRVNYAGLDSGPVIVQGTAGVHIIAAERDAWTAGAPYNTTTSFVQLMGLPAGQLSDTYVFPAYNNVTLNEQLRIGNVDSVPTTVTVTIGGVLRGTYPLAANQAVRVNYAGLDSGPVIVQGTAGVHIIAAERDAWSANGVFTSFSQLMGVPAGQLSDTFVFPTYNNVTLNEQLRIGNVDSVPSTVTVTIGGVLQGTYILPANGSVRVNYAGIDNGPVVVQGTNGVHIIAAERDAFAANGVTTSFIQLMGLPAGQLSDTYVFPAYNNVTLSEQLRFGVP